MTLPLFDGSNYTLTPESPETARVFEERSDGSVTAGWEMLVPPPGPDGSPYQYIFVGPTAEHRGTSIRLTMVTRDGDALSGGARVTLETYYKSGEERTVIYEGEYARFLEVPDQQDPGSALSAQRRAEAGEDYVIRLLVTAPEGDAVPDAGATGSRFELECVKLWWNETA